MRLARPRQAEDATRVDEELAPEPQAINPVHEPQRARASRKHSSRRRLQLPAEPTVLTLAEAAVHRAADQHRFDPAHSDRGHDSPARRDEAPSQLGDLHSGSELQPHDALLQSCVLHLGRTGARNPLPR